MRSVRSLFDDGADYRRVIDTTNSDPEICATQIANWLRQIPPNV